MVTYHYVKLYVSIIIQLEVFQWEMIVGALKKFKFDMFGLDRCLFCDMMPFMLNPLIVRKISKH
jgi:hypothetical protein